MFSLLLTLTAAALPGDSAPWTTLSEGPIRVACAQDGGTTWCRAWGDADAAPEIVGQVIEDRAHYADFYTHIGRTRVLADGTFQMVIDYPSIIDDRDMVVRPTRLPDRQALVYQWTSVVHPELPEEDGVVRLAGAAGEWRVEPRLGGGSVLRYTWNADLGGSLPSWILERIRVGTGEETLTETAREAERRAAR